jgi:hypothetical protein
VKDGKAVSCRWCRRRIILACAHQGAEIWLIPRFDPGGEVENDARFKCVHIQNEREM